MARANPEISQITLPWSQVGSTGYNDSGVSTITTWDRSYSSYNTAGFPNVVPLPFRAHTVDLRRFSGPRTWVFYSKYLKGSKWWYRRTGPRTGSGQGAGQPSITSTIPNADLWLAADKARSKVIQDIQRVKVNVAQNIAEYRQVHRMFGANARRIANAYRALRHGDVRGFAREIPLRKRHKQSLLNRGPLDIRGAAPSIWLESQYGWKPLLGDIYTGITNFYQRVESGYPIRAVGRGVITRSWDETATPVGIVQILRRQTGKYRCLYIIEYEVDHSQLANMDDWGLTNPLLLAWELLPYSFVVDWFLPVGSWLSQVGYSLGLHYRRGMRTALAQVTTIERGKAVTHPDYERSVAGSDVYDTIRLRRELVSGFPNPGLPRVDKNGLRGLRIANALSLLSLAFDRHSNR